MGKNNFGGALALCRRDVENLVADINLAVKISTTGGKRLDRNG